MNKNPKQKPQIEQILEILKRLTSRIEDATIDISSIKTDIETLKLDIKEIKKEMKDVKKAIDSLILTNTDVLAKMVTQEEFQSVSHRVAALETQ